MQSLISYLEVTDRRMSADDLKDSEKGHVEDTISVSSIKLYFYRFIEFHNTSKGISQVNESPTHISSLKQST